MSGFASECVSVCSLFSSLFNPARPAVFLITQRPPGVWSSQLQMGEWRGCGEWMSGRDERRAEREGITGSTEIWNMFRQASKQGVQMAVKGFQL